MPIVKKLNQDFFKKWTPEMAYVLGYFAADGSMVKNKRGAHFIEFNSTDHCLILYVQKVLSSNHHIKKRIRSKSSKWKPLYRLQLGSRELYTDLSKIGFTQNKSLTMCMPHIPVRFQSNFVRGYFDGDGSVHFSYYHPKDRRGKKVAFMSLFTSGSREFLSSLKKMLARHALQGGSLFQKQKSGYTLLYSSKDTVALYRFMYHTRQVPTYLPRKKRIFEKAIRVLGYTVRP